VAGLAICNKKQYNIIINNNWNLSAVQPLIPAVGPLRDYLNLKYMVKIFQRIVGIKGSQNDDLVDEENEVDELYSDALEGQDIEEDVQEAPEEWNAEDYEEGQLSIDVFQTKDSIVVKSTIAGVKTEDIDISINNDMLTIRGQRSMSEEIKEEDYLYKECYWGSFSRSIILPVEIQEDKIDAVLENGVLTIVLPKAKAGKGISIKVKEK